MTLIIQFLLAFQFLTIFPIRISGKIQDKDLPASMAFYPLVGGVIGALSAGVFLAASRLFSAEVGVVSAVVALIVFSGALHLDGFADMCDGFYGHRDPEKVLAIMKDSRSGAMAIIGVFCLLALKIALLGSFDIPWVFRALVLAPALGRWSMVWLSATSMYARPDGGTASAYIGHVNPPTLLTATISCAGAAFLLLRIRGLVVMAAVWIFAWAFRRYTQSRIGGATGDTLGACSELVEVFALMILSVHGSGFWS